MGLWITTSLRETDALRTHDCDLPGTQNDTISHVNGQWTALRNPGGAVSKEQKVRRKRLLEEQHLGKAVLTTGVRNSPANSQPGGLGDTWPGKDLYLRREGVLEWATPGSLFTICSMYINAIFLWLTASSITVGIMTSVARCMRTMRDHGRQGDRTVTAGLLALFNILLIPKHLAEELLRNNRIETEHLYNMF